MNLSGKFVCHAKIVEKCLIFSNDRHECASRKTRPEEKGKPYGRVNKKDIMLIAGPDYVTEST